MKAIRLILLSTLLFIFINAAAKQPTDNTQHPIRLSPAVNQFIDTMVKQYHFNRAALTRTMKHAEYNPTIIEKITYPYEQKPWNVYRGYFITPTRIAGGTAYWEKHKAILDSAAKQYGVDPSVIVAIIGMETNYGTHQGTFSALDALSTLSFYYPPRQKFFKSELTQLLLLARDQHLAPAGIKSSYAGAIGIPQFMPSTYRHYAVAYHKHEPINLTNNDNDAILSIANYLRRNGWHKAKPIASNAVSYQPPAASLVSKTARPTQTLAAFKKEGIHPETTLPKTTQAALIDLTSANDQHEYWFAFHNFRVIMRYNPRVSYAMAVYQLSRAIQEAYVKT